MGTLRLSAPRNQMRRMQLDARDEIECRCQSSDAIGSLTVGKGNTEPKGEGVSGGIAIGEPVRASEFSAVCIGRSGVF